MLPVPVSLILALRKRKAPNLYMLTIEFQEQGLAVAKMDSELTLSDKDSPWLTVSPNSHTAQSLWDSGQYSKIHNKSQQCPIGIKFGMYII